MNRQMDVSSGFDTNESFKSDIPVHDVKEPDSGSDVEVSLESDKSAPDIDEFDCDFSDFNPCTI